MQEPTLNDIEHLMTKLAFPFYQIERDAVPPFEPRRFENDVEHSWSVAFLACSLAPEIDKNLDVGKIAQFAIAHDLIEVFAGDTSPWHDQQTRESKEEREEKALKHIEKSFARFPWIIQTIREYESRTSDEAKFVWAVDKVIILLIRYLDKGRYYVENGITKQLFDQRLTGHRKKAQAHPKIGEYYEQLLEVFEAHPEYFHGAASPSGPTASVVKRLQADLLVARKAHDRLKTEAIQSVLAAISNKEAVPPQKETHDTPGGVGSTEVARRVLSDADIAQVIRDEISEIQGAIDGIGAQAGQPYAAELKQKLAILTAYL
jgi:5'-deoxynucleotidase YfbR-like HD superfamily hydrolase/uncharacterized protein YqeY